VAVKIPEELVSSIITQKCALFVGSGISINSGGASWEDLIIHLKNKFNYDSPLENSFQIVSDLKKRVGRTPIYQEVQNRLKDVKLVSPVVEITRLPWYLTFTTNYDISLETALRDHQQTAVCTIVTGNEFELTGLQTQQYCVKLMGSIDIADGQPGHMILDRGDLEVAYEERSRIFDILATHAARLTFLFIGYSFNDEIFLEIIDKLSNRIGTPQKKYYAVFKERPDEKKMYLLNQYGIIPIIADIDDFCKSLNDVVSIHDFRDLTRKKIPLGNDVIAVNPSKASSFFSQFYPILLEDYDMPIEPISFFKGNTESLQPFILKWHYPRKEIDAVINEVIKTTSRNEPSI